MPCKIPINNRREVEVDMEKCKKGIQNIAQNKGTMCNVSLQFLIH